MEKLKTPKDYPVLYVRTSSEEKEEIENLVEEILSNLHKKKSSDEKQPKRNQVILKALLKGLKALKREMT